MTSPVGTYPITPTLVDPSGKLTNYTVSSTNGTLSVTAAGLTVAANNASRGLRRDQPGVQRDDYRHPERGQHHGDLRHARPR